MRFTKFSIPDSNEWMEKSDILFLVDCCNKETPFISKSILDDYEVTFDRPFNVILDRIHPEDLVEFVKVIEGRSSRPAHHKLRIIDRNNSIQLFSFHKLKTAGSRGNMLLAISKKQVNEPVMMNVPVNW